MVSGTAAPLLLLFWLNGVHEVLTACENVTSFSSQLELLLAEYDRENPPEARVVVELSLDARHASVVESASAVQLLAELRMMWNDSRLSWNATEWGCDWALVSAERLWVPDVTLVNAASSGGETPQRARLTGDGSVAWVTKLDVTTPIGLSLADWPRDVQTCSFKFGSRAHTIDELDIVVKNLKVASVFESGAWEILSLVGSMDTRETPVGGQRRVAEWALALRRRASAHALAAAAVLCATAAMLLAATLLPPVSRAPLFATASLTAALWLTGTLPRLAGGSAAPRAVCGAGALCAAGGAGGAAAALLLRLAARPAPPPAPLRALVAYASSLCKLTPLEGSSGESGAWGALAQLLDHALTAVLALTVLIVLAVSL